MSFTWLAPLLVLGVVILVHEAGHFWAAKFFGVYAPRFAIGFGPTLWRKRWGETEYVIGALPLGGYVRMATRDDEASTALEGELTESKARVKEELDPTAMIPFGPLPVPPDRWFESKPLWQRAIIMLAGVTMNIVLAIVVCTTVLMAYGRVTSSSPPVRPIISSVVAGMPAAAAGMLAGDSIVSVDGVAVRTWTDMVGVVSTSIGRELPIDVMRNGEVKSFRIAPVASTDTTATGEVRTVGRIGAAGDPVVVRERASLFPAIAGGGGMAWRMATGVVGVLKGLFTGQIGVSQLGGPVEIARASVQVAKTGLESLLLLIAFLSVNLAILNLVPIPLLDGGQLVMQTAETARGRPFSDRTREWIARFGLAAIATLFLVVTFNDIKRLVLAWMG